MKSVCDGNGMVVENDWADGWGSSLLRPMPHTMCILSYHLNMQGKPSGSAPSHTELFRQLFILCYFLREWEADLPRLPLCGLLGIRRPRTHAHSRTPCPSLLCGDGRLPVTGFSAPISSIGIVCLVFSSIFTVLRQNYTGQRQFNHVTAGSLREGCLCLMLRLNNPAPPDNV